MRKVTQTVVDAFLARRKKSCGNSVSSGDELLLHGNVIAKHTEGGGVVATLAGWPTVTTRERLNGLARSLGSPGFHQSKHEQYFNDQPVGADDWVTLRESVQPAQSEA